MAFHYGSPLDIQLIHPIDSVLLEAIGRLRAQVWRAEDEMTMKIFGDADIWTDPVDSQAYHWVVYLRGELVASARLSIHASIADAPNSEAFLDFGIQAKGPIASINRLVVAKSTRGLGIARALDLARLNKAKELGAHTVLAVPAGHQRRQSLAKLGYVAVATDLNPQSLGIQLENVNVSLMVAAINSQPYIERQLAPISAGHDLSP